MKKLAPQNILIIKFRNIGDVLLTAPLISTLKLGIPDVRVCAAVKKGTEEMLQGHPHLDALYILPTQKADEGRWKYFLRYVGWLKKLRKEKFDLAINTTEGDRGIILSFLIGAKERWAELRNSDKKIWRSWLLTNTLRPIEGKAHTVTRTVNLASSLTRQLHYRIHLEIDSKDLHAVERKLTEANYKKDKPLIHIHPTSRWFFKCWPDSSTAIVINGLMQRGIQVALTCAPERNEHHRLENIIRLCNAPPINLGGQLTLKQTAALSRIADHFFGVDSAPMHMAATVNTPVTCLFGPSGAFDWGPWPNTWKTSDNPYQLKNGIQETNQHLVIQKKWACVPCGQDGCEGCKKSACLDSINPKTVLEKIIQRIK